ncbi:MAG: hypothetical protein ACP5M9_03055 [Candidatus Micrarchaeia archaeon]
MAKKGKTNNEDNANLVENNNKMKMSSNNPNDTDNPNNKIKHNRTVLYIVLGFAVIVAVLYMISSFINGSTQNFIGTTAGTPAYLGYNQSTALIGKLSDYATYDIFNNNSPLNITVIEEITPFAAGNVTEGWFTGGAANNKNVSLEFFVMKTYNISRLYQNISNGIKGSFSYLPKIENSKYKGMNYSYLQYLNSTFNVQFLVSEKNDYLGIMIIDSNSSFQTSPSSMINSSFETLP